MCPKRIDSVQNGGCLAYKFYLSLVCKNQNLQSWTQAKTKVKVKKLNCKIAKR